MKITPPHLTLLSAALLLASPTASRSDDIEATFSFRGSVVNNAGRQTLQGLINGSGEYDPIDSRAVIRGSLRTAPGERAVAPTVLGAYPTLLFLRAKAGREVEVDNFKPWATLYRRSIVFQGYGRVTLNRPVNPRRPGRQLLNGRGRFEFDE